MNGAVAEANTALHFDEFIIQPNLSSNPPNYFDWKEVAPELQLLKDNIPILREEIEAFQDSGHKVMLF